LFPIKLKVKQTRQIVPLNPDEMVPYSRRFIMSDGYDIKFTTTMSETSNYTL